MHPAHAHHSISLKMIVFSLPLQAEDIKDRIANPDKYGGGGGGGGAAPAAAAAPAKAAAAKAPEPEEEEDMGFSLFD